jgi:CRISPR type III-associated protein (TIGR04423 family)
MSSQIETLRANFATIYDGLQDGTYEGYVQMSDRRIEHIHLKASKLWTLDELYGKSEVNYVLEMALFDPATKKSILVRQHNDTWLHRIKELKDEEIENADSFFIVTDTKDEIKMKIAQIWEEEPNEFCLNMKVLEPKYLLFAGFKGGES